MEFLVYDATFTYIGYELSGKSAPTDISLSNASINENQSSGTAVGTLSSTDPDTGNTFAAP